MTVIEADPPVRAIHRIKSIVVGERGNRDLTGLDELKASIAAEGLIHPLILSPDRHLVLGARRLEACMQLGWTDVPAMTVTGIWQALDYLGYEHADPRCLRALTVQEAMGMDMVLRGFQWWPKVFPPPGEPGTGRNVGNGRRRRIGGLLGLGQHQYVSARELWQATRGYRESNGTRTPVSPQARAHAITLMAGILAPADINGAHTRYKDAWPPPAFPGRPWGRRPRTHHLRPRQVNPR